MTLIRRNRNILLVAASCLLLIALPAVASAQGRGRGWARGNDQSWKCGKFVNCHDARNGRLDGRGPRRSARVWRNGIFVSRGARVGNQNRYSTNDYWRRRHLMYRRDLDTNRRYRRWRSRY